MKPFGRLRQRLGKSGEDLAARYLQGQGYRILARNFRIRYGELDIVAEKGGIVVVVEVKTRSSDAYGTPEDAITPRKLHELEATLAVFVHDNSLERLPLRIDCIAVDASPDGTPIALRHIPNVTG